MMKRRRCVSARKMRSRDWREENFVKRKRREQGPQQQQQPQHHHHCHCHCHCHHHQHHQKSKSTHQDSVRCTDCRQNRAVDALGGDGYIPVLPRGGGGSRPDTGADGEADEQDSGEENKGKRTALISPSIDFLLARKLVPQKPKRSSTPRGYGNQNLATRECPLPRCGTWSFKVSGAHSASISSGRNTWGEVNIGKENKIGVYENCVFPFDIAAVNTPAEQACAKLQNDGRHTFPGGNEPIFGISMKGKAIFSFALL